MSTTPLVVVVSFRRFLVIPWWLVRLPACHRIMAELVLTLMTHKGINLSVVLIWMEKFPFPSDQLMFRLNTKFVWEWMRKVDMALFGNPIVPVEIQLTHFLTSSMTTRLATWKLNQLKPNSSVWKKLCVPLWMKRRAFPKSSRVCGMLMKALLIPWNIWVFWPSWRLLGWMFIKFITWRDISSPRSSFNVVRYSVRNSVRNIDMSEIYNIYIVYHLILV